MWLTVPVASTLASGARMATVPPSLDQLGVGGRQGRLHDEPGARDGHHRSGHLVADLELHVVDPGRQRREEQDLAGRGSGCRVRARQAAAGPLVGQADLALGEGDAVGGLLGLGLGGGGVEPGLTGRGCCRMGRRRTGRPSVAGGGGRASSAALSSSRAAEALPRRPGPAWPGRRTPRWTAAACGSGLPPGGPGRPSPRPRPSTTARRALLTRTWGGNPLLLGPGGGGAVGRHGRGRGGGAPGAAALAGAAARCWAMS